MLASEVIREARNVLFERGWYQGDFGEVDESSGEPIDNGRVCAYGALHLVQFNNPWMNANGEADEFVENVVPYALGTWNDAAERTFDEVIDAFDRAEKLALIEEQS